MALAYPTYPTWAIDAEKCLGRRNFRAVEETSRSAKEIVSLQGDVCAEGNGFVSHSLVKLLFDSLIEEEDDDELVLISLRDLSSPYYDSSEEGLCDPSDCRVAAICFYRLLSGQELLAWIKAEEFPSLSVVSATEACSWILIEAICVAPSYLGQHLGSLTLAAALSHAATKNRRKTALLHVAGGASNKAAQALYRRFQFEDASKKFNEPNDSLMVLRDINRSLSDISWDHFLPKAELCKSQELLKAR